MSSINPNNIDGTYPIAGQDNDSQGFRNNFTNIKNNLNFALSELNDLQLNAILKAPLGSVGQTVTDNNLNYSQLVKPQLVQAVETSSNIGVGASTATISWADGAIQQIILSAPLTLTFSNWPQTGLYVTFRLQVTITDTAHTLTLPSSVSVNLINIGGIVGQTIKFPAAGVYLYEFSTYDGGATIIIRELLNNYQTISGARYDTGYQYSAPTTGFNTQVNNNVSRVIFDPVGTLANGTITLPTANLNAQIVQVSSTASITAFQVKGSGNVVVKPSANITLAAGTGVTYFYKADEWAWYKIN